MTIYERTSNYDKYPEVKVDGYNQNAWQGYDSIVEEIKQKTKTDTKQIICIEAYPGVREDEVLEAILSRAQIALVIKSEDAFFGGEKITKLIEKDLTDDRIFGVMTNRLLEDFIDPAELGKLKVQINAVEKGIVLVYGVGASLVTQGDLLIYADLARWEIQKRYKSNEIGNFKVDNYDEDFSRKHKRGYFFDWRIADKYKKGLIGKIDYLLDTNEKDDPKLVTGDAFREGLRLSATRPFSVVPFFEPGVWGGQWMKEVCDLDRSEDNFAWCFNCVPEENSLYLRYGDVRVEVPAIDLVMSEPRSLLGEKVYARFGAEFPIRFNFLDTVGGENLSLQVHPITEYIHDTFGMKYTQDESYYILDANEDACVYLGTKEGINPKEMIQDLKAAQEEGAAAFDAEKYVNKLQAKKHDHFLIPGGTIHCSGDGALVLEISSTPNLFTFKLWDWERVDLDGLPRPINIEHGKEVIQWERDTPWVEEHLVENIQQLESGEGWRSERTGLHEYEFIETVRYWFSAKTEHDTKDGVHVINLVEGEEAIVESPTNAFEPFVVHYVETFIVPASIGKYTIRPYGRSEGKEVGIIKAFVRV